MSVVIAGGGPAGSATARRLAQLGHSVTLVERRAFPRPHVGESLSPGVWIHFATLGITDRIASAGFRLSSTTLLRWRGETERIVSDKPSLIVDRARFDALMLDAARDAGVDVVFGNSIPRARFFVDATGRANLSRRKRRFTAPRLLAWHTRWQGDNFPDETHVERCGDAWIWGTKLPDDTFSTLAFGDPSLKFEFLTSPIAPPHAFDATPYVCESPIDATSAAVGEAAFAIDPISSSGVQCALASGITAAIAIHTILDRPSNTEAAIRFYTSHVQRASSQHARWTADTYSGESDSNALPNVPLNAILTTNHDAQVIAPTIRDNFVELAPAIRTSSGNDVAYLGGTPLAPLVASLPARTPAHAIVDQWSNTIPRPHATAVLSWLVREGVMHVV
jgi:2-polyprenyl-6-methoxyphenol hydroxylase-like FAD-dependent oxidoreductase